MKSRNINTYGELLNEIERVEGVLKEIRSRPGYDYLEDDYDFIVYLEHLKSTKEYNEKRFEFMKRYGIYECEECGSVHLEYEIQRDFINKSKLYGCTCEDCGHQWVIEISLVDLKNFGNQPYCEGGF